MILVDSNILIYSFDINSSKNAISRIFLSSEKNLCISQQNFLETYRVITHDKYSKPMKSIEALEALELIVDEFKVIFPTNATYKLFKELCRKYIVGSNVIFDVYLIATMLSNGINIIATDNAKDFAKFEEIKILNLFK